MKRLILTLLLFAAFTSYPAAAQIGTLTNPCSDDQDSGGGSGPCDPNLNLNIATYNPTPLSDGSATLHYGDPGNNVVSLYGTYGNNESVTAPTHYNLGVNLGNNYIKALCHNGAPPVSGGVCSDVLPPYQPAIVFLFIGFSNCDIEICGGNSDAWDNQGDIDSFTQQPGYNCHLAGQPCATQCPNIGNQNPHFTTWWNQVNANSNYPMCSGGDGVKQQSFIYQIYSPSPQLVGPHVAVFDGALGSQTLDKWDPTPVGYYANHNNCQGASSNDPECNYDRVEQLLIANGYTPAQVQAVFLKASNPYPQCDMKGLYCNPAYVPPHGLLSTIDAYQAEQYLGDIMRFLKQGLPNNLPMGVPPPYPNLQQVFLTSRTYGGYANASSASGNGSPNGCLDPEPFAYEPVAKLS